MVNFLINGPDGKISRISEPEKGCWIEITEPDESEVRKIKEEFDIDPEFLAQALDPTESGHAQRSGNQILLICDCCYQKEAADGEIPEWTTGPVSIILTDDYLITICIRSNPFLEAMKDDSDKRIQTEKPILFFLILMKKIASEFQENLRTISYLSDEVSAKLYKKMNNQGLQNMMALDKSLIYFSSSLQTNQNLLEKLKETEILKLDEKEETLLDADLIEYKQASKMCNLYISVNERISEGCSNILSNRMNITVEKLTVITIVLSIPALVFGFYGMNVKSLNLQDPWIPILIALIASTACLLYFRQNRRF